jgi:hypothetical protein
MEFVMTGKQPFTQREKREIDRQLDEELEGTFPASDPPTITRYSANSTSVVGRTQRSARAPKFRARHLSIL